jgi:tetratricopeptide (TPR) repeat protein
VLETRSVSYGKATAYLPLIDLLKGYCGIEPHDDARRIRERLTGKLLTLDPALGPTLPAFLSLLDVPVEDAAWQALDPPQRRQRTLDGLKRLLLRESQEQPLLLVFEDLHWIDAETQGLLDSLVDSLPTARILFLVNYRPEYDHVWHRKTYYQQLRLDPLPAASAEELLDALVGHDTRLEPLKRLVIQRTEGNPFFVEESIRTLVEAGVLAGQRGAYHLAKPFQSAQVPATVQAVLAARIDRLAPEDKRLLQSAAVVGKDVPYPLLRAIAQLPENALRQGVARLQAAEFLYETSLFPDLEYTFKHALTHEVAYRSLLHERRRALHAQIVEAVEALYQDRQAEHVELLAHHALRGEAWGKAVTYLHQAGVKAAARSAHREAVAYFEQALLSLEHVPASREIDAQAIDVRLDLRASLVALGRFEHILDYLLEADALARGLQDPHRSGRISAALANHYFHMGDHPRAIAAGQQALAVAREVGDHTLEALASLRLGQSYQVQGEYHHANSYLQHGITAAQGDLVYDPLGQQMCPTVSCRCYLAWCYAELGQFAEAAPVIEEGIQIAEVIGRAVELSGAYWTAGDLHVRMGDLAGGIARLERSVELARDRQVWYLFGTAAELGHAYALAGRPTQGLPLLEQAVEEGMSMGLISHLAIPLMDLGETYLLHGRLEEAGDVAARLLEHTRSHRERGHEAWALRLLAEIAAQADSPEAEQAESYYRQALVLADELGMRPLAAHCHLGLGTLYCKIDRRDQARAELTTAAELYRQMEMTFWLKKAEVALAQRAN